MNVDQKLTSSTVYMTFVASILWPCRKQDSFALSTYESEYLSATLAFKEEALWLQQLLEGIEWSTSECQEQLYIDNSSTIDLARNKKKLNTYNNYPHIITTFRSCQKRGLATITHLDLIQKLADGFTYPFEETWHEYLNKRIGIGAACHMPTASRHLGVCQCADNSRQRCPKAIAERRNTALQYRQNTRTVLTKVQYTSAQGDLGYGRRTMCKREGTIDVKRLRGVRLPYQLPFFLPFPLFTFLSLFRPCPFSCYSHCGAHFSITHPLFLHPRTSLLITHRVLRDAAGSSPHQSRANYFP